MSACNDTANPQGLEDYCAIDASSGFAFEYHYTCTSATGTCQKSTGTKCGSGKCIAPVSPDTWSHKCEAGSATAEMKVTVDALWEKDNEYVKRGFWRSCQAIRTIVVNVTNKTDPSKLIVDRGIDVELSSTVSSAATCNTKSYASCNPKTGVAYFTQKFGKFTADTYVVLTAKGTDNSGMTPSYLTATGTQSVLVKPNKLQISQSESGGYAVSKATKKNTVKSCEAIIFSACVLDEDFKTVTQDVEISFKIKNDARSDNNKKCTVAAGSKCCNVEYTAPAVDKDTTYDVEVNATAKDCYMDADPKTTQLIVKAVKLVIKDLAASPTSVKTGEEVTTSCTVVDSIDAKPVSGADVSFNLTQKSPGTAVFTGTGQSDTSGKASAKITPTTAGTYNVWAAATMKVVAPNTLSCYVASDRATSFTPVEVKAPTCTEICTSHGYTSTGACVASTTSSEDCGGPVYSEESECTANSQICCCSSD
jgi:hypothetical protein